MSGRIRALSADSARARFQVPTLRDYTQRMEAPHEKTTRSVHSQGRSFPPRDRVPRTRCGRILVALVLATAAISIAAALIVRIYDQWVQFHWTRGWVDGHEEILYCIESKLDTALHSECRKVLRIPSRGDRRKLFLWLTECDLYRDQGDRSSWPEIFRLAGRLLAPKQYISNDL